MNKPCHSREGGNPVNNDYDLSLDDKKVSGGYLPWRWIPAIPAGMTRCFKELEYMNKPCHSREGGNPVSNDYDFSLDDRKIRSDCLPWHWIPAIPAGMTDCFKELKYMNKPCHSREGGNPVNNDYDLSLDDKKVSGGYLPWRWIPAIPAGMTDCFKELKYMNKPCHSREGGNPVSDDNDFSLDDGKMTGDCLPWHWTQAIPAGMTNFFEELRYE